MLVTCRECQREVSSKAISCPHCGFPMNDPPRKYRKSKRRRLPNGFGQITEIKGRNLRKPFRAMVTVGKNEEGRPIVKLLKPEAYFATYNEAYAALMKYNESPFDVGSTMTVEELHERWKSQHYKNITQVGTMERAWKYAEPLYSMRVVDIRARHIRQVVYHGKREIRGEMREIPTFVQFQLKNIWNLMLDYALEYEIVTHNYARDFKWKKPDVATKHHISFTEKEMKTLWKNKDDPMVGAILIQCYMGWRPGELVALRLRDVNPKLGIIVGGNKTKSGRDRIVPIHSAVKEMVLERYAEAQRLGSEYLIRDPLSPSEALTPSKYTARFARVVRELSLNESHRPHDPRKQFVTMAKKYGVDEYAIKRIVGHAINDLTESVYTDRDINWLKAEIEKIRV